MTERLYYTDSYTTRFTARIVERTTCEGQAALVLDRTYFYPTSGGQPADRGTINGVDVLDVTVREADGAVLHVMAGDVPADTVEGVIDWQRRFDHMQHHTGQHILTQAFIQVAGAHTVGFHLGEESVTIDLDRTAIPADQVNAAEDLANQIVAHNLPVRAWFPAEAERANLPLRKVPDVNGKLRVVSIGDFDVTACGGTHVAQTGEIGLIKVIRTEKYKDMTRVEFRCGGRALADYRRKNAIIHRLMAALTTGADDLEDAITRLQDENRHLRGELRAARQELLNAEAAVLWQEAPESGGLRVIARAWEGRDPQDIRPLASRLIQQPGTVVLLGVAGDRAQIVMARSEDLPGLDMVALLRRTMSTLTGNPDERRGGGRPDFAQGGGISADAGQMQAALNEAAAVILKHEGQQVESKNG